MVRKMSKLEGEGQGGLLSPRDQLVQERLLKLREQHRVLHERKIATERDRVNLEERLRELRAQADRFSLARFGTRLREVVADAAGRAGGALRPPPLPRQRGREALRPGGDDRRAAGGRQRAERGRRQALAQRADHATSDENELHCLIPE